MSQCQYSKFGRLVLNFHRPHDLNCAICRFWDANRPNQIPGRGHHRQHGLTFKKVKMTQNLLELVTLQPAILELQTVKYAHEFQHILIQIFYKTTTIAFNAFIF